MFASLFEDSGLDLNVRNNWQNGNLLTFLLRLFQITQNTA